MRQSIEKKQETKPSEVSVTVMFHGKRHALGENESFRARESSIVSLSGELAVIRVHFFDASSPSGFESAPPERRRARSRSLSQAEKISAEGPMACSALAVSAANPNTRSPQAGATPITTTTEQRHRAVPVTQQFDCRRHLRVVLG